MIALPPGCTVNFSIYIDVDRLSTEMIEWFEMIGGRVQTDTFWDHHHNIQNVKYVSYGKGKWCYHHNNGFGGSRLHFMGEDAATASVFLIKFFDHVTQHNFKEQMERVALDKY